MRRLSLVLFAAVVALTLSAETIEAGPNSRVFVAVPINGAQEVPPRATKGQGVAILTLSPDGTTLRFNLVVTQLKNVVGAHVHSGAKGVNGPIIIDMYGAAPGGGVHNGLLAQGTIIRGVTPLPAALGAALNNTQRFDELITRLRSGNTYVNVHTNDGVAPTNTGPGDFPGGEIRGQLLPRP